MSETIALGKRRTSSRAGRRRIRAGLDSNIGRKGLSLDSDSSQAEGHALRNGKNSPADIVSRVYTFHPTNVEPTAADLTFRRCSAGNQGLPVVSLEVLSAEIVLRHADKALPST